RIDARHHAARVRAVAEEGVAEPRLPRGAGRLGAGERDLRLVLARRPLAAHADLVERERRNDGPPRPRARGPPVDQRAEGLPARDARPVELGREVVDPALVDPADRIAR